MNSLPVIPGWRSLLPVCLIAGSLLCAGCGKSGTADSSVSGTVKYEGQPVGKGTVLIISGEGNAASADLKPDGTYSLKCRPGSYQVAVSPPPVPDPMVKALTTEKNAGPAIPVRYGDVSTSGLQTAVAPGANTFNIDLRAIAKGR